MDAQKIGNVDVSTWRGFNLPGKYYGVEPEAVESDFKMVSELGFNFVRLCLDYRRYVAKEDWLHFNEDALKEIDRAVECGTKYNVHVCLDLHCAPGYIIGGVKDRFSLWDDREAQDAFFAHWEMFAKRYKGIPQERLSFNLVNEPARTTQEKCLAVFLRAIEAIHQVDPKRLIVVDGFGYGAKPFPELVPLPNVIQATRGYTPMPLTHYKASWAKGNDRWSLPTWPIIPGLLYGPIKKKTGLTGPLALKCDLGANTQVALRVYQVSGRVAIVARADGKTVWEKTFMPADGKGEWKEVVFDKQYNAFRNIYDKEYAFRLPDAARELSIENSDGDFLSFTELCLRHPDGKEFRVAADVDWWGAKPAVHVISPDGKIQPSADFDPEKRLSDYIQPWLDIAAQGETVFVGEFGAFNKTPHDVTLAWMKCWLERWRKARFGWALWNLRGGFGILDSNRADVQYEDFNGHKLDRKMLESLRQYMH
ncbi:MAG: cellulase family glycosylhydrolase [Planctomycetota bacterium]